MPAKVVDTAAPRSAAGAGEQMPIADRRVAQAQRVDRKIAARLGGDGRAVGAARVFGMRRAPVLRRGVGGIIKAGDRRRQFDDRLDLEPVPDVLGCRAGRQRDKNFPAAAAGGSGKIAGMAVSSGGIIGSPGDARQGATAANRRYADEHCLPPGFHAGRLLHPEAPEPLPF
jgi:hypothetical protein